MKEGDVVAERATGRLWKIVEDDAIDMFTNKPLLVARPLKAKTAFFPEELWEVEKNGNTYRIKEEHLTECEEPERVDP